ncbi:hypothetical protein J3R30DRAFT_3334149 [Lentinula aciculospora]|uniref:RNB domain-containing protein n=1 Tax=Lentinula aciculospora TaxID=153920 RepID=A0A9W9AA43_9AGAR|nr:hypothetical protein J3R30DRAFT_3334149 [Lentinula aciculospora]
MLAYYSLTSTGEVWEHYEDDVFFSVPAFVEKGLAGRCGGGGGAISEMAETKQELKARVEVLKKIRGAEKDIENAMNVLMSRQGGEGGLDVYEITRAQDGTWGETTVGEVARLFGPGNRKHKYSTPSPIRLPTFAHTFAAHKYLVSNPLYFVLAHDYSTSKRVRVRPSADVRMLREVEAWVRAGRRSGAQGATNPLESFISQCRARRRQNPLMNLIAPPTRTVFSSPLHASPPLPLHASTWSPASLTLLTFLLQSLKPQHHAQSDPYLLGMEYIIKKIYTDEQVDNVSDEVVHRLLIEVGGIEPWRDLTEVRALAEGEIYLGLGRGLEGWDTEERVVEKSTPPSPPSTPVLGPEDFYPADPVEHLRYDFGDMQVYVIDDVDAKELDDGISYSPSPSQIWIHIHIADPTSLLPPTHILSKHAERMTESMYLVHRTFPMLPRAFTHHTRFGFSLGCTSTATTTTTKPETPQPTLTFSVRLDIETAEILEYKIRPGLVRNLVICTYDDVDSALGFGAGGGEKWKKPFEPTPPAPAPPTTPPAATLSSTPNPLSLLYKASQSLVKRRYKDGEVPVYAYTGFPFFQSFPPLNSSSSSSSSSSPTPSQLTPYLSQYLTTSQHILDTHSRSLVAECMKLASRACSMFCRDNDVPILRRWADPPLVSGQKGLAELLERRTTEGYLLWDDDRTHILGESSAGYTLDLRGHWGLGIPDHEGYVRCTSPLRRYADLVVHWQLKAALIAANKASASCTTPSYHTRSTSYLYTPTDLESFAIKNKAAERFRKRIAGQHEAWWNVVWLMRYLEWWQSFSGGRTYQFTPTSMVSSSSPSPFSTLPNPFLTLTATLTSLPSPNRDSKKWQVPVYLTSLGIKAVLIESSSPSPYNIKQLQIGDTVPVQVNAMRLGVRPQVQVVPRTV